MDILYFLGCKTEHKWTISVYLSMLKLNLSEHLEHLVFIWDAENLLKWTFSVYLKIETPYLSGHFVYTIHAL